MPRPRRLEWINVLFLTITPVVGVGGTLWYALVNGVHWMDLTLLFTFYFATGLSIATGYHRLFSHRAYTTRPWHEVVNLLLAAATFQNSALRWSRDHRIHHRKVDTDDDPYNIKRGFWWAHIGWIFYKNELDQDFRQVPDLLANPRVMWQHRNYLAIAVSVGLVLPTLIGWTVGRPFGGLLWGGILRLVLVHHCTFFINSLAHMVGSQPYTDQETARDSWWLAYLTFGEGYHNYHHKFPADYRNGHRWFDWDPAKWWVYTLQHLGQAWDLRRMSEAQIQCSRMAQDQRRVRQQLQALEPARLERFEERLASLREGIEKLTTRLDEARHRWRAGGHELVGRTRQLAREELRRLESELREARRAWQQAITAPMALAAA